MGSLKDAEGEVETLELGLSEWELTRGADRKWGCVRRERGLGLNRAGSAQIAQGQTDIG